MKSKIFYSIVLLIFSISACSSIALKIKSPTDLENTLWSLDTLNGTKVTLVEMKEVTLGFDKVNNKIRGTGGCNEYFGDYIKDANKINFSNIGSTKMACDNMNIESSFLGTLPKIDKYEIDEKTLYMFIADKKVMVFHEKE